MNRVHASSSRLQDVVGTPSGHPREVATGEISVCGSNRMLSVIALGSCIAVVVMDVPQRICGVAHVMLPGPSGGRFSGTDRFRCADEAIPELLWQLKVAGARHENYVAVLAGAGNVLRRPDDSLCDSNIRSVHRLLAAREIPVVAERLGGTERKRILLDTSTCTVECWVGDGPGGILWSPPGSAHHHGTATGATNASGGLP